jgi:hypothetical protein
MVSMGHGMGTGALAMPRMWIPEHGDHDYDNDPDQSYEMSAITIPG